MLHNESWKHIFDRLMNPDKLDLYDAEFLAAVCLLEKPWTNPWMLFWAGAANLNG